MSLQSEGRRLQAGFGRSTRWPVTCEASSAVYKSVGKGDPATSARSNLGETEPTVWAAATSGNRLTVRISASGTLTERSWYKSPFSAGPASGQRRNPSRRHFKSPYTPRMTAESTVTLGARPVGDPGNPGRTATAPGENARDEGETVGQEETASVGSGHRGGQPQRLQARRGEPRRNPQRVLERAG